jgi:hypothetical protein
MAVATVVIAFLTWSMAKYSAKQWKAMIDSNETNRMQLELSQRPWVGVVNPISIVRPLTFDAQGGTIVVQVSLKNCHRKTLSRKTTGCISESRE